MGGGVRAKEPEFGSQDLTRVEGYKFVLKVTMEGNKKGTRESGSAASVVQVGQVRTVGSGFV